MSPSAESGAVEDRAYLVGLDGRVRAVGELHQATTAREALAQLLFVDRDAIDLERDIQAEPNAAADASHQVEAANWTAHALDVMEPDAAIVSWWSYSTPLWYAQRVQGLRPDIAIIDDRTRLDEKLGSLTDVIDANLGKRPVYVIRIDPNEIRLLADRYDLEYIDGGDARMLTRVIGRKAS